MEQNPFLIIFKNILEDQKESWNYIILVFSWEFIHNSFVF